MTVLLTERQQRAQVLARELEKLEGVWVTSPLPLDDSKRLRVQVLDSERNEVTQTIRDWGYEPVCCGVLPRVHHAGAFLGACIWEIDLPRPRQQVVNDRPRHSGEIADKPPQTESERTKVLKHLGLK